MLVGKILFKLMNCHVIFGKGDWEPSHLYQFILKDSSYFIRIEFTVFYTAFYIIKLRFTALFLCNRPVIPKLFCIG